MKKTEIFAVCVKTSRFSCVRGCAHYADGMPGMSDPVWSRRRTVFEALFTYNAARFTPQPTHIRRFSSEFAGMAA
jgi:hypothetical protein